ncbi:MAG TPA: FAD-dependent thymidylate synthase, partial [Acidimicrobiales bacterium]|nr:FAD-dependent thymidylate synthase [Acidimicrobiales bacterium]
IYGTGQAYEQLLLRMRAHPLPEARTYADLMLRELRKVIPSFLRRVDLPDRGGAWSAYLETNRKAIDHVAAELLADDIAGPAGDPATETSVALVDWDPDGEHKVVAAMLYPHTHLSEEAVLERVRRMSTDDKIAVVRAYAGERGNRRHRPGRALERTDYRFDILSDYGAFRDLQRHRMLTIEWQALRPSRGYAVPEAVAEAGGAGLFVEAMERSARLYEALCTDFAEAAPYAVCLAYRIRFCLQLNAREAMHMLELRTTPQGHPTYRRVCQEMHRLIAEEAGHPLVAGMMRFVDHRDPGLERLEAERRAERRRA